MSNQINITKDGLEFLNDSGRRVVIRPNHSASADTYIDLPTSDGTISTGGGADGNDAVKVSANDTTAGFLEGKLVAGSNITLTTNNDGGNETLTIDAAGGGGGGGYTFYDVTLADAENTTAATDVAKITIPANTWLDGQAIVFDFCYDLLNQSGGTVAPTVLFGGTGLTGFTQTGSWNNSGTTRRGFVRMTVFRNGEGTYTSGSLFADNGSYGYPLEMVAIAIPSLGGNTSNINLDTSVDFANSIDLYYRITFPTAHASLWLRPWNGCAYKTEKGASL